MKYANVFKVSNELIEDDIKSLSLYTKHQNNYFKRTLLKKSIRLLNAVVELFDQDGDNFVQNNVTVRIRYDGYKIPRIIKNRLL